MRLTRSSTHRCTSAVLVVLLATAPLVSACSVTRPVPFADPGPDTTEIKGKARVTLATGSRVYLQAARLTRDSIIGNERVENTDGIEIQRRAIGLQSVARIESQRTHVWKTVLLTGGIILVVLGIGSNNRYSSSPNSCLPGVFCEDRQSP